MTDFFYGKPYQWYKNRHKEMWTWLADNVDRGKRHWPGWDTCCSGTTHNVDEYAPARCFACGVAVATYDSRLRNRDTDSACNYCPIESFDVDCDKVGSMYLDYVFVCNEYDENPSAENEQKVREAALAMANVEWCEEIDYEGESHG